MAAWRDGDEAPVDLAAIDEHPELAQLILWLRQIDLLTAACVRRIGMLEEQDDVQTVTGVSLTAWMSAYGRRTTADIRMLRAAVNQLRRVPSLREAFDAGQVSWSQVRSAVLSVQRLPGSFDQAIDQAIGEAIAGAAGAQPDAITFTIRRHVDAMRAQADVGRPAPAHPDEYLGMQAFKDGSGGRFWGEAGSEAWAILDAALNADVPAPATACRRGFAGDPTGDQPASDGRATMRASGRQRLQRLTALLDATLAGGAATLTDPPDGDRPATDAPDGRAQPDDGPGSGGRRQRPDLADWWARQRGSRPQLIVRAELDMLLNRCQTPASLLTTLLGGSVTLTADAACQLLDARGADLRTIILNDTGQVVGIGRRNRVPPGWLRDAVLALHDTCSAPTCTTPVRVCELDHASPWHPVRPEDVPGRTDIDQLAPLCRRDNAGKERDGWSATQQADGTRRWHHQRSGFTIRTLPATWRPPPGSTGPP